MQIRRYARAEKDILDADGDGIRQRWRYGLRILHDPQVITDSGKSLRHGKAEELIEAAESVGISLSATEIRYRVQCARAYPTESQIAKALGDFRTWWNLIQANFPPYPADPDDLPADYRTDAERRRAARTRLLDAVGDEGRLFPVGEFEPDDATLKDLIAYAEDQDRITNAFVEHGRKRWEYLNRLLKAVHDDTSKTWLEAHLAAFTDDDADDDDADDE